jgi:hypothetical protein
MTAWGTLGKIPQSYFEKCTLADTKRLREYTKKQNIIKKIINKEEREKKMSDLKDDFQRMVNMYE